MTPFLHIHPSNCFYLLLLFYRSKSDWDEMKSQSSFTLHFSDNLRVLNILKNVSQTLAFHLLGTLCLTPFPVYFFLIGVFLCLMFSCLSYLSILHVNSPSDAKMFPPFFSLSFLWNDALEKPFNFMWSHLWIFRLSSCASRVLNKKPLPMSLSSSVFPIFSPIRIGVWSLKSLTHLHFHFIFHEWWGFYFILLHVAVQFEQHCL